VADKAQIPRQTRNFTVAVARPDYLIDVYGQDVYVAKVAAYDIEFAKELAQRQACHSDCVNEAEREDSNPEDYRILAISEVPLA